VKNRLPYCVILLPSTTHALRAEKIIIDAGYACKMIPVPRNIRSDCGVCLRVEKQIKTKVLHLLARAKMDVEGFVDI
jgi:hypothetical protein